jgi:hypothetical protein
MRHFYERIRRIIAWIPVLWGLFDFDNSSIYKVLLFQIQRVRKVLENDKYHHYSDKAYRKMITCELLLQRVLDDNYHDIAYRQHNQKWGELEINFGVINPETGNSRVDIFHTKARELGLEDQERKEYVKLYDDLKRLEMQDLELFGKLFAKQSRNWWS